MTVQQRQQQSTASSEKEVMEQDDSQPLVTPPEKEEREAEIEGKIERPRRGQGAYGRSRNTFRRSSVDGSARAMAQESSESEQRVTAGLQAAGGHPPPGPGVPVVPHRDSSVFNPSTNYNREAFPPPQWHITRGVIPTCLWCLLRGDIKSPRFLLNRVPEQITETNV